MKKGWLIYDEAGAKRNEWFIAECFRKAEEQGLQLSLYLYDGSLPAAPYPDFALVRTIAPRLSAHLAGAGTSLRQNIKELTGRDVYVAEYEKIKKSDRVNSAGRASYVERNQSYKTIFLFLSFS